MIVEVEPTLRPEIATAWRRAQMSGLDPGMGVRETSIIEVDRRSRLITAAGPVLDSMLDELADTGFSVLLADRTSKIVDRRDAQRGLNHRLDDVLAVPGVQYLEEMSGTNSLATAFELQKPIAVTGDEHFLESFRDFACYGAPIRNPVTRRVEGVLDVTGPAKDATQLLGTFIRRAVRDIELRLLKGSRTAEQRLLTEFQEHSRNKNHAVLVLSETLVLSNPTAMDLVRGADHAALLSLSGDLRSSAVLRKTITLVSGTRVDVAAHGIESTGGVLYDVVVAEPEAISRMPAPPAAKPTSGVVAVVGEPGTGRTCRGLDLAGADAVIADCVDGVGANEGEWTRSVVATIRQTARTGVLLDNVHLLSDQGISTLAQALRSVRVNVILTSSPAPEDRFELSALLATASQRHELRPVRMLGNDFSSIANLLLDDIQPGHGLRIAPSAMRVLAEQPWPGNLHQLRQTIAAAARGRTMGEITAGDLPATVQARARRRLTVIETAERDTIVSALISAKGNKAAAARELGIGRTTLYQRLNQYGVT